MLKANNLLKKFKEHSSFALFSSDGLSDGCGLMCISGASLGKVEKNGSSGDNPMLKVFSQSAYIILPVTRASWLATQADFVCLPAYIR